MVRTVLVLVCAIVRAILVCPVVRSIFVLVRPTALIVFHRDRVARRVNLDFGPDKLSSQRGVLFFETLYQRYSALQDRVLVRGFHRLDERAELVIQRAHAVATLSLDLLVVFAASVLFGPTTTTGASV